MWVRETCIDQQQKAPEGNHSQQFDKLSSAFLGGVCLVFFRFLFLHIPPPPPHCQHLTRDFFEPLPPSPISIVPCLYKVFTKKFFK